MLFNLARTRGSHDSAVVKARGQRECHFLTVLKFQNLPWLPEMEYCRPEGDTTRRENGEGGRRARHGTNCCLCDIKRTVSLLAISSWSTATSVHESIGSRPGQRQERQLTLGCQRSLAVLMTWERQAGVRGWSSAGFARSQDQPQTTFVGRRTLCPW